MKLLSVKELNKKFNNISAVKDVSFTLKTGKCIALIGPNGAGKTTILRMLAGTLKPTSGQINFTGTNNAVDHRALIGYLPQHPVFPGWMTGEEFLIYSGRLAYLSKQIAIERAKTLLKQVGIFDDRKRRINQYSGGMKQRLGIAQALIHEPKLLMLDEPVSALDPLGRRELLTLMEQLKEKITILFSTHILSDADEISDELLLIHQGKIVQSGSLNDLRKEYKTTVIELKFATNGQQYLADIEKLDTVSDISIKRQTLHIVVNNIPLARKQILSLIQTNNWPLENFAINQASLEDLFMKVVH